MAYDAGELGKPIFSQFWAVKILFPGVTARFFTGRGSVQLFSETYTGSGIAGEDGVFGDIEPIEGTVGTEAPRLKLTLGGLSPSAVDEARDYVTQGATVIVYDCLLDMASQTLIGSPELVFYGFVDVPSFTVGEELMIELDCASALEYLFTTQEGQRWNDASQQAIYSGDKGFEYMSDTSRPLPWGLEKEARPTYTGATQSSGSGFYPGSGGSFR